MKVNGKLLALILVLLLAAGGMMMIFLEDRWVASADAEVLKETAEQLDNPDRGFYLIHAVKLTDNLYPEQAVEESFSWDRGHSIALVEISLADYAEGDISKPGLDNLAGLFDALRKTGMHYIVRFVYDWDGHNMEREPMSRKIIERHMEQAAPVIDANADQIYTLQGLFVGNWGEMNGTRYTGRKHWRGLAKTLAEATEPSSVYMSVRTPMQWRNICGETESDEAAPGISSRMGLFNDGMLGSSTDLGTYGDEARKETGYEEMWPRKEELNFQEKLCRSVPNGGEVVMSSEGCSLDTSLDYLRTLHVSYLNEDYDKKVLDSWASEKMSGGVWDGTDGLSYVRAHLGYRYTASNAKVKYSYLRNRLDVSLDVSNTGFAPAYFPLRPVLSVTRDGEEIMSVPFSGDLSALWGGDHSGSSALKAELPLSDIEPGDCQLLLRIESDRGRILLANEGRTDSGDLIIGRILAE